MKFNRARGPQPLLDVFYSFRFMNTVPDVLLEKIAAELDRKGMLYADIRALYEKGEYAPPCEPPRG